MPLQYLLGTTGNNQLFCDNHLWYNTKARPNYWTCIEIGCKARLSTNGDTLKDDSKPFPKHSHDAVSDAEFIIKSHFTIINTHYHK